MFYYRTDLKLKKMESVKFAMPEYSFNELAVDIREQPELLKELIYFLEHMTSATTQRLAKGKNKEEFVASLLFVLETKLPKPMAEFMAQTIFHYLQAQQIDLLKERFAKIKEAKDTSKILHYVKFLLNKSTLPKIKKREGVTQRFVRSLGNMISKTPAPKKDFETMAISKEEMAQKKVAISKPKAKDYETMAISKSEEIDEFLAEVLEENPPKRKLTRRFARKVETLMSSGPPILKSLHSSNRYETVMDTQSPLKNKEAEELRSQTLVYYRHTTNLKWVNFSGQELLFDAPDADFMKVLKNYTLSRFNREQKQFVSALKSSVLIRSKLLIAPEIIINTINQGENSLHHTLNKLSKITDKTKLNEKIWDYLYCLVHAKLTQHSDLFRDHLLGCSDLDALDELLYSYKIYNTSFLRLYPDLKIIAHIKKIKKDFARYSKNLDKIMNKHLGVHGEANTKAKLTQLLAGNIADEKILEKIRQYKNIDQVVQILKKARSADVKDTTEKMVQMVEPLLISHNRISFVTFKSSLNFVSSTIRNKILTLVRHKLRQNLSQEINNLRSLKITANEKLPKLQNILQNPCYDDPSITIFTEQTRSLANKIPQIQGTPSQLEEIMSYVFANPEIPKWFYDIIKNAHLQKISADQKNPANCYQALEELKNGRHTNLKGKLVDLFHSYGGVNFSTKKTELSGYEVARSIQRFYNNPNRTTIELPANIHLQIGKLLKEMIDTERKRQLEQL